MPTDPKVPYDCREVLARVVDGSEIEEFKPRYGVSTLCAHASITGIACAVIGNNGPIDPNGATKAAQFIQACDQADLPIIFFQNTTGYVVGTEYERAGMIKHGSKMIQAVSTARVPKISLYIGASFGAWRPPSTSDVKRSMVCCAAAPSAALLICLPEASFSDSLS